MSIITEYPFNNAANYVLDNALVQAGSGQLGLVNLAGQLFTQGMDSGAGFVYDTANVEFAASNLQQKQNITTDLLLHATFAESENANIALGSGTGTLSNGAILSDDYISLASANANLTFDSASNVPMGQTGCIRVHIRFPYTGNPSVTNSIVAIRKNTSTNNNAIILSHLTSGNMQCSIYNDAGAGINIAIPSFSPTPGKIHEIEINFDIDNLIYSLMIDGTARIVGDPGGVGTRNSTPANITTRIDFGATFSGSQTPAQELHGATFFDTVQHTDFYTPSGPLPDWEHQESITTLPVFANPVGGQLISADSFTASETGAPHYTVSGKWFNGAFWIPSNRTYAESNDRATVAANIAALDVSGLSNLAVEVVFKSAAVAATVDEVVVGHTSQAYSTSGTIETAPVMTESLVAMSETTTDTANTSVRYSIRVNNDRMYYSVGWKKANISVAPDTATTNTLQEVNDNIATLLTSGVNSKISIISLIQTSNQSETSLIDSLSIEYDFGGTVSAPAVCTVWGYYRDITGAGIAGADVAFTLRRNAETYKEAGDSVIEQSAKVVTRTDGYFEIDLIRSSSFQGEGKYYMTISHLASGLSTSILGDGGQIEFEVPDLTDVNISDLIVGA